MLEKIWIFQPDKIVSLGRFEQALNNGDVPYALLPLWDNPPLPDLNPVEHALIILGGRPSALNEETLPWLKELYQKLPGWVEAGLPVLGICLGHQILAHALGGKISLHDELSAENGPCRISLSNIALADPLFGINPTCKETFKNLDNEAKLAPEHSIIKQGAPVYQSHHDIVEVIPVGATLLASSDSCQNQAFRYQNSWGVQFHPESTAEIMRLWTEGEGKDGDAMYQSCQEIDFKVGEFGLGILEKFLTFAKFRE